MVKADYDVKWEMYKTNPINQSTWTVIYVISIHPNEKNPDILLHFFKIRFDAKTKSTNF